MDDPVLLPTPEHPMQWVKEHATPRHDEDVKGAEEEPVAMFDDEDLDVELLTLYQTGCFRGGQMSGGGWAEVCLQTGVQAEGVTEFDVVKAFADSKLPGTRSINYHQFRQCIAHVAPKRFPDDAPPLAYAKCRQMILEYVPETKKSRKKKGRRARHSIDMHNVGNMELALQASEELEARCRAAFRKYDANKSSTIDREELRSMLADFGFSDDDIRTELCASIVDCDGGMGFEVFTQFFNRLQVRERGRALAGSDSGSGTPPQVKAVFERFCSFGHQHAKDNHAGLEGWQFAKMARECRLIGTGCPLAHVDVIFETLRPCSSRQLGFSAFEDALVMIAARLYPSESPRDALRLVHELIIGTALPSHASPEEVAAMDAKPAMFSPVHMSRGPSKALNGSGRCEEADVAGPGAGDAVSVASDPAPTLASSW